MERKRIEEERLRAIQEAEAARSLELEKAARSLELEKAAAANKQSSQIVEDAPS